MITQIQLGNIFSQNDRTILTGGQSGLDIEGLVDSLVQARRQPAVILESTIEANAKVTTAVTDMRSILDRFRDAAGFLRNPPGVQNQSENIFEFRKGAVSSNSAVAGSNYMSVTAEPGANTTNYDMQITQLATRSVYTTNTFAIADADTAVVGAGNPFQAGPIFLGANAVQIDLDDGDSLNQVEAKINAAKDLSGIEAIAIKVANGQYRLSLKSVNTGTDTTVPTVAPPPPSFVTTDAIFRFDANDINGNGNYSDNPTANQAVTNPVDGAGTVTMTAGGTTPTLDVDGASNGQAAFDFSAGNGYYALSNNAAINTGTYQEKSFAFSFQTGADITGTQVIYEQGGGTRSYSLQIMPDAGNGNAATLYAVAHNTAEWVPGEQYQVLNLGVVTANTDYNVVVNFDATANPTVNDTANTFTGFVNGVQVAQQTGIAQMAPHSGGASIGATVDGLGLANGTTATGPGLYFKGKVSEIAMFNKALSATEISDINNYYDTKYSQPISSGSVVTGAAFAGVGFAITQNAQNAIVQFDGTTIERSSNSINDIVEGVTFNLLQETPVGTDLEVEIKPDLELARTGILNFVDAYNEFRLFASAQSQVGTNGRPLETSVLAGNSTLTLTSARINAEIASIVEGITGGDPSRLSDIGIEFSDFPGDAETPFTRNILVLDEDKLDAILQSDFDAVRKVFEFDYTSDDPDLQIFRRNNQLGVSAVSLNIDQTNGIYEATYLNSSNVSVTIALNGQALTSGAGVVLNGVEGTVLEGLTMIYGSPDDAVVNLGLTQGVGDRIFNTLDDLLNRDTGAVSVSLRSIQEKNERLQTDIQRIDNQLERYRDQLLEQYSALEAAINSANTILQTLEAQANAASNN